MDDQVTAAMAAMRAVAAWQQPELSPPLGAPRSSPAVPPAQHMPEATANAASAAGAAMPGVSTSSSQTPAAESEPAASVEQACEGPAGLPQLPAVPRSTSRAPSRRTSLAAHRASQSDPAEARAEQLQQRYSRSSTSSRRTTASALPMTISASLLACPICLDALRDPALLCQTGITYCRACITAWLQAGKTTCPVTHSQLHTTALATNYLARSLLPQHQQAQSSAAQQAAAVDQALAALAQGSAQEQAAAAEQLAALCVDNGVWAPSLQHNVASMQELVAGKGAVPLLLGLCRAAPPPAVAAGEQQAQQVQAQVACLRALRNLVTGNTKVQKQVAEAGGAFTYMQLLAGPMQHLGWAAEPGSTAATADQAGQQQEQEQEQDIGQEEAVQLAAAQALWSLLSYNTRPDVKERVAAAGGIPLVARLLWCRCVCLQEVAGCLLRPLLCNTTTTKRLLLTVPGVVVQLKHLLGSQAAGVRAAAGIALCFLCTGPDASAGGEVGQARELEGVPALVIPLLPALMAPEAGPAIHEMACNALLCFVVRDWDGRNTRLAGSCGARAAVRQLLRSQLTAVQEAAQGVAEALDVCASDEEGEESE